MFPLYEINIHFITEIRNKEKNLNKLIKVKKFYNLFPQLTQNEVSFVFWCPHLLQNFIPELF